MLRLRSQDELLVKNKLEEWYYGQNIVCPILTLEILKDLDNINNLINKGWPTNTAQKWLDNKKKVLQQLRNCRDKLVANTLKDR